MDAILLIVRIRRRTFVISLALLAMAALGAAVYRERAESAAEASVRAMADETRAVLLRRDDQQLEGAFARTRTALAEARAVTLYHVANEFDGDFTDFAKQPRIAGYPVRGSTSLNKQDAQRLVKLLTTRSTYFPAGDGWSCIFEPRHVLQLTSAQSSVTAVICVHCGDVEFVIGKDSIGTRSIYPNANGELSRILASYFNSAKKRAVSNPAT